MKLVFLLFLLFPTCFLAAQGEADETIIDLVETLSGQRYEGKIVHYEYGKMLTLRLAEDGREVTFATSEVRRLRYGNKKVVTNAADDPEVETFMEDWRNDVQARRVRSRLRPFVSLAVHGGRTTDDNNNFFFRERRIFGFTLAGGMNYRVLPWLAAGVAGAYDRFDADRGASTLSGLATLEVLVNKDQPLAPYLRLGAGYGLPVGGRRLQINERSGGLLIHPSVGLRLGKAEEVYYTADLGYRFLNTSFSTQNFGGEEVITNEYRRLSVRFAATF